MSVSTSAVMAHNPSVPSTQMPPALVPLTEASRQWGDIGKTATYAIIERHGVKIVHVGSRSMVAFSEVMRVVDELIAASNHRKLAKGGRVLAAASVAARRKRNPHP